MLRAFGLNFGVTQAIFVLGWSLVGLLVPTPGGAAGAFLRGNGRGINLPWRRAGDGGRDLNRDARYRLWSFRSFGFFYFVRGDINFARLRSLSSPEAVNMRLKTKALRRKPMIELEGTFEGIAAGSKTLNKVSEISATEVH